MKKNFWKQLIVLFLFFGIFTGLLPTGDLVFNKAAAAVGSIHDSVDANGATTSHIVTHVTSGGDHTITENNSVYEVTGNTGIITVAPNISTTIILMGVTRESATGTGVNTRAPLQLGAGSTVTLVLLDGTTNTFTCNGIDTANNRPQAGIHVPASANLIIRGQTGNSGELFATGGAYSAGIGAGPNESNGNITIEGGQIYAYARIHGSGVGSNNAAGIGSGGGNTGSIVASTRTITICGNANVTASSTGRGAGIGGGSSNQQFGGSSGTINIHGNAIVTATSSAGGAGIGGGGSRDANAGHGGVINIYENANVTATSMENGAGIGGGGAGATGTPGASGTISIYGNATVVAETNSSQPSAVDIGPGVNNSNALGSAGIITIVSGNVYADKATIVTNSPAHGGDALGMVEVTPLNASNSPLPNTSLNYTAHGSLSNYTYTATSNNVGKAFLWLPLGNQLIICRDEDTNAEIGSNIMVLPSGTLTPITPPTISGYTISTTPVDRTWDGTSPLTPIVYLYRRTTATLTLEAYNSMTGTLIGTATYTTAPQNANANYNYSGDIPALTALVNASSGGPYTLVPQSPTIYHITEVSANNVVRIYYAPQQANVIFVEARIGSTSGTLIQHYVIPASSGETITLSAAQMPNLGTQGFTTLPGASLLSATEGTANNKIILVYADARFITTIRTNLDATVISNRTAPGGIDVLSPPFRLGYHATMYSLDGGTTKIPIPSGFTGYSTTTSTNIIFYYETANSGGGGSGGGTSSGGGSTNSGTGSSNNNVTPANATITISCVDEGGNEIYVLSLTSVVGSLETISAPPLDGYVLAEGEPSRQSITVVAGDNFITFKYVEVEDTGENPTPLTPPETTVSTRGFWWWLPLLIAFLCGAGVMYIIYSRRKNKEEQV